MFKLAINDVAPDLELSVWVGTEASTSFYSILVDDSQWAERFVLGVIVACEGKCVESIEPAMISVASGVPGPLGDVEV